MRRRFAVPPMLPASRGLAAGPAAGLEVVTQARSRAGSMRSDATRFPWPAVRYREDRVPAPTLGGAGARVASSMNNEKRFVLFIILMFFVDDGIPLRHADAGAQSARRRSRRYRRPRRSRPRRRRAAQATRRSQARQAERGQGHGRKAKDQPAAAERQEARGARWSEESELVLGSETDKTPGGYRLQAQLTQKGAGVESLVVLALRRRVRGRPGRQAPARS